MYNMITVDTFLTKIANLASPSLEELFPARDAKVLRNLVDVVNGKLFLTENQSKLLLKILKENEKKLSTVDTDVDKILNAPLWSRQFRKIEQVRTLKIGQITDGEKMLIIEFTFSSQIRKVISGLAKKVENLVQAHAGKLFYAELTEKNIVTLVEALAPFNFDVDETVKNHYETIKSWSEEETKNQFLITNISHSNFQKQITQDLGISTPIDENIIADRGMRYQYYVEKHRILTENLTKKIAWRANTKIWIDSNSNKLEDVIKSLIELKRLPIMFVFDRYNNAGTLENLKILSDALEKNEIFDGIGIYFRMPNDENGKPFNEFISERQYNCQLDNQTKVVGVQSGKIPKFFLTNSWKPMSVVSLGVSLRHSKTAVYANCSDLVITYSDTQPLKLEMENVWE